jgi:hypothetical protein
MLIITVCLVIACPVPPRVRATCAQSPAVSCLLRPGSIGAGHLIPHHDFLINLLCLTNRSSTWDQSWDSQQLQFAPQLELLINPVILLL